MATDDGAAGSCEPRWLTPDELECWLALNALMVQLPGELDARLRRDHDLSLFEYLVMAGLSDRPDRTLQMKVLAEFANGSLSRLSHVVSRLERRGFVTRAPSPDDGRVTVANLTDAGLAALVAAAPGHVEAVRALVFDQLRPPEVDQLRDLCDRVLTSLSPGWRQRPPMP